MIIDVMGVGERMGNVDHESSPLVCFILCVSSCGCLFPVHWFYKWVLRFGSAAFRNVVVIHIGSVAQGIFDGLSLPLCSSFGLKSSSGRRQHHPER